MISKKEKVFAEIRRLFLAEIENLSGFSCQKQVISKKKRKGVRQNPKALSGFSGQKQWLFPPISQRSNLDEGTPKSRWGTLNLDASPLQFKYCFEGKRTYVVTRTQPNVNKCWSLGIEKNIPICFYITINRIVDLFCWDLGQSISMKSTQTTCPLISHGISYSINEFVARIPNNHPINALKFF